MEGPHEPGTPAEAYEHEPSLWDRIRTGAAILGGVALLVFFLQNLHGAEINFLWFEWKTRMVWALIASALVGGIAVGSVVGMTIGRRRRRAQKK